MRDRNAGRCSAGLLLICAASIALAQPPAPPGELPGEVALPEGPPIALVQALTRTLAANPALLARGFDIPAAEGRAAQADLRPYPEISVVMADSFGTGDFRGTRSAETTLTLGWVLERGRRRYRVATARADLAARTADLEIARLDAAAETARRFLDCLAYQERLRNAENGVGLARLAVDAVGRRVAASRSPAAELARAEAELVRAELIYEDYEHELLSAYHRLSAQWGVTDPDFGSVDGSLEALPVLEPFESLLGRVEQNPDFERFVSQERLHEAELELARARSRPTWLVNGGIRRIEGSDDFALVGGITVPLRLGNSNQGRIAEARAELARNEAERAAARVAIETELFVLYQRLRHDIQLPLRLEADVIPGYESALAETRRAFELGRSSYLELRAVQSELFDVNTERLEAYIDAHRLVIEIERLTGERIAAPGMAQRGSE